MDAAIKKLSAWQVLRNRFPESEYVLLCEVSDASGHARSRSLDYMIINLWQSRGLAVTGIEQKSNRGDWLKEIKNPAKQENHFKHCDYFFLLTDKENVAKIDEIPASWGWYHINERGVLKTMKAAPKLKSIPIERSLMCAMLRRAADKSKYVHVDELENRIQAEAESIQKIKQNNLERKSQQYDELLSKVIAFEKHTSISLQYSYEPHLEGIGKIIDLIQHNGLDKYIRNLERVSKDAKHIHDDVAAKIEALKEHTQKSETNEQSNTTRS